MVIDSEEKVRKVLVNAYPARHWAWVAEYSCDETDLLSYLEVYRDEMSRQVFHWEDVTVDIGDSPLVLWTDYYNAIFHANLALESIGEMGETENLMPYKGEALICRAFCHFILVNIFCNHYNTETSGIDPGVPYVTAPEKNFNPRYDRETVETVYRKIEEDLTTGLPLLDDKILQVPKYHFNRLAALAFASRFYLYKSEFEKVIEYSSEILDGPGAPALRDWKELKELEHQDYRRRLRYSDISVEANLMLGSFHGLWSTYGGMMAPSRIGNNLIVQQTEGMHRSGLWGRSYMDIHLHGDFSVGLEPYFAVPKICTHPGDLMLIPLFTTEEVLLNRAEAYVRLSGEKGDECLDLATGDISTFLRAYSTQSGVTREMISIFYGPAMDYYTWDKPTPKKALDPALGINGEVEAFIHALLHLRRSVFIHEGFRWFDIKRYGIEIYRREIENGEIISQTDFMPRTDPRRAIQIPLYAIKAGMKPNPR
ncbi:MAG: RagB/SusD family nutrient uptake outer membrane protein [Alistipes sp.]|nr:RagB/SusD family nutrient uptake outer membrane protein [Alistipes sp.]